MGDRREVSLTLRVSNHYEPNDRYLMNIRNVRLSPISEGSLLASPLVHFYVGAGFSPSPLFRGAFRSAGLRALSGPQEDEKGLFRGNGEQFYAAGSACCAGIPCIPRFGAVWRGSAQPPDCIFAFHSLRGKIGQEWGMSV
jgi:hypothetical protein